MEGGSTLSDPAQEASGSFPRLWLRSYPVIPRFGVSLKDERVPLSRKYLDGVDCYRLRVDAVRFDDGHVVSVGGDCGIGVAGRGMRRKRYFLVGSTVMLENGVGGPFG